MKKNSIFVLFYLLNDKDLFFRQADEFVSFSINHINSIGQILKIKINFHANNDPDQGWYWWSSEIEMNVYYPESNISILENRAYEKLNLFFADPDRNIVAKWTAHHLSELAYKAVRNLYGENK